MHVQDALGVEVAEQVLAPRLRARQAGVVQQRSALGEAALRAGRAHPLTGEAPRQLGGEPVQGVSFGHRAQSASRCVREHAGLLVRRQHPDPAAMPLVPAERGGEEPLDHRGCLVG